MKTYSPEAFETLCTFEVAKSRLATRQEQLPKLGAVIRKAGLQDCVGVSLLHKHFELGPHERLVDGIADGKRCCRPQPADSEHDIAPYMWRVVTKPGGDWSFCPLQFFPRREERLDLTSSAERIVRNGHFLAQMASELIGLELQDTFGISLLHRDPLPHPEDEMLVETTDEASRTLLFSALTRATIDPATLTQTLWTFECDECDSLGANQAQCRHGCQHCYGHCKHCYGYH